MTIFVYISSLISISCVSLEYFRRQFSSRRARNHYVTSASSTQIRNNLSFCSVGFYPQVGGERNRVVTQQGEFRDVLQPNFFQKTYLIPHQVLRVKSHRKIKLMREILTIRCVNKGLQQVVTSSCHYSRDAPSRLVKNTQIRANCYLLTAIYQ